MRASAVIAVVLSIVVAGWMLSGQLGGGGARPTTSEADPGAPADPPPRVRVKRMSARSHGVAITVRGRSEAGRRVDLRAETDGRIVEVAASRGDDVRKGSVLARLSVEGRLAKVAEYKARLRQRRIHYEATAELAKKGLSSKEALATATADIDAANAAVEQVEVEIARTRLRAPFDGLLLEGHAELGDYLKKGDRFGRIIDLDPIPSVLDAKIGGDRKEVVEIIIDPMLMESYEIDAGHMLALVARSNTLVAAGHLDTGRGRFAVKVPGLFESMSDTLDMPLRVVLSTLGLTVNIVVLFSLILAVGMLVDGAIVVTEYADRKMREGELPRHAYVLAARRMSWPIIASTATTLAAFAPLLFWPGIVGEFMKYLPITLLATLSASLLMALVFVPVLGSNLAPVTRGFLVIGTPLAGGVLAGNLDNKGDDPEDVIGTLSLEFADWHERRPANEILAEIRERTDPLAGILVETRFQRAGPPVGKPVALQLTSRDPELLAVEAARVAAFFRSLSGLKDIEDGKPIPGIEWEIGVDRTQAAKFGIDVATIGQFVQLVTRGLKISDYRPDDSDEEIEIVIRYPETYRTIDELDRIRIPTADGGVPIGNFVERRARPRTGTLRRTGAMREISVRADVLPGVLANDKVREIGEWIAAEGIDPRVEWTFRGEDEEQQQAREFLIQAFGIALFVMALILVTQFNRFYSALLILSAVVLSTVGVLIGLLVTRQPFGIVMSGIGVIALAGIVVNNNIVLIDTFDRLRRTIADPVQAILRTGAQRLRPVILTTVTTICGLMPMVMQVNIDLFSREITTGAPSTQWWTQLATAVAFGLAFATVLTLMVTPCALMVRENYRARAASR